MQKSLAISELERSVFAALETYSNVHRGSGHFSIATTHLYEQARAIILEYLELSQSKYIVIFCTSRRAEMLKSKLNPDNYRCISSRDIGLALGVNAIAVKKKALPKGAPFQSGGGTTRLVSRNWVVWAKPPDKFEAGTPPIVNIIAFARALQLVRQCSNNPFQGINNEKLTANEIMFEDELLGFSGKELLERLRQTLVGFGIQVPTTYGLRPFINLDNSASTPTFTPVWNVFRQTLMQNSQIQQEIINKTRFVCAEVLNAPLSAYDVIFTSNTTEAINLVAESMGREFEPDIEPVILNTFLEHNSNDLPWRMVPGYYLVRLSIDNEGFLDLKEIETMLRAYNKEEQHGNKRIRLIAVCGASNVLGTYNDLAGISRIAHQYGARLLVDGAQMVAHSQVELQGCDIDYFAFSAHKVYAPFGSGAIVVKKGLLKFSKIEMEHIRTSGEDNAAGIAAMGKSLLLLQRIGLNIIQEEERALTSKALNGMAKITGLKVYGIQDPNSPQFLKKGGVIVFSLKGIYGDKIASTLARKCGIGTRFGCHCTHILIKKLVGIPPSLEWIQRIMVILLPKLQLPGLVRVSFGIETTKEEVDVLINELGKISKEQHSGIRDQVHDFVDSAAKRVYS